MGPEAKTKYLKLVDDELISKQESLESIEHGRNTAESAMTSHHDHLRSDLAQDASILQGVMDNLKRFRGVLDAANPCTQIQEGAFFTAQLIEEGETLEAIYSPVKITMAGVYTITSGSPLGQSIKGLKVGDVFSMDQIKISEMLGL